MPSDRSRRTDRPRYGYTGVVAQQGRVILDRDFNAGQGLTAARIAADALDFVGPCGTPDDGFLISLPGQSPPGPPFWSPPVTPPPESPPVSVGGGLDFLIAPGTMYVGGERVEFPAEQDGRAITYSYFDQPDYPAPPQPGPDAVRELAYLDLTEQEVSAVEDPDLLEVALGGPDTTQRLKLLRRVRRMAVPAATCTAAWDIAVKRWAAEGWQFDPATMRLVPAARLLVGFTQDASASDPCDPVATGGYLGADNQLIRVRLAGSRAAPTVLWGYDNASFLYPVTSVSPDGTTLTLAFDPPDALHVPQAKQVVEILQTAAVLATEPNETDPGAPQPLLRVVADQNGHLRKLAKPYGPATPGSSGNAIVLATALPMSVARSPLPLFLRVWQAEMPLTAGTAQELTDPVTSTSTGVTVTITSADALAEGAYWLIAVRPATPQGAYPESLLKAAQPPDGPRRWACPLAVIDWRTGTVTDCRSIFDNLVTLTARKPGCCTVAIRPSDVTAATPLQALIDRAAAQAENVTVCLSPGIYTLPQPLRLDTRHAGMTLESCGGPALLRADPTASSATFAHGLLVLAGTRAATLRGLSLLVPYATTTYEQELPGSYAGFGIRAVDAPTLTVEDCIVEFRANAADDIVYLLAAGVFLQGNCSGLTVQGCTFGAGIAPTYNAVNTGDNAGASAQAASGNRIMERFVEPASMQAAPAAAAAPAGEAATKAAATPLDKEVERFTATLQPSGPPVAKAELQANRVKASMQILMAQRPAAAAEQKKVVIATVGVMACDYTGASDGQNLDCNLGNAVIRDTSFSRLTFATLLIADARALRLQDNTATGCVAGLWYVITDATTPESPADGTDLYFPQVVLFEECLLLLLLLEVSAPPQSSAMQVVASQHDGQAPATDAAVATDLVLFVVGNRVDPSGTGNTAAGASSSLLLAVNGSTPTTLETIGVLSVIVSANQLRSACGLAAPTALLTLPAGQPCAITGNVILNISSSGEKAAYGKRPVFGPSLWLMVADSGQGNGTVLLSVTGNALLYETDLLALTREGSSPPSGWFAFNANPS